MNTKILAAIVAAALISGCAATNKATNPEGKVASSSTDAGYDKYENYQNTNDDEYLRMKVQNPSLWGSIDDYSYWNNSQYDFGYSCDASRDMLLSSFYNPYGFGYNPYAYGGFGFGFGWNSWYSPYQTVVMYKSPTVYFNSTPKGGSGTFPATAFHYNSFNNGNITRSLGTVSRSTSGNGFGTTTTNSGGTTRSTFRSTGTNSSSGSFSTGRSSGGGVSGGSFRAGGGRH
jgi:hypothetical protein